MKEKVRVTFYGKEIKYKDLTHQHLSNIIWFNRINNGRFTLSTIEESMRDSIDEHKEIDERFGSIILPYKPLISFPAEIDALKDNGYLQPIDEHNSDIFIEGRWIGKVIYN